MKRSWSNWFLLLAIVLSGCNGVGEQIPGDGRLVVVGYDHSFSQHFFDDGHSEEDAVKLGIQAWNVLGANLKTSDEAPGIKVSYMIHRDTYSWPAVDDAPTGVTWPDLHESSIYPNVLRQDGIYVYGGMYATVVHEVGHSLGLYHVSDKHSFMSARAESVTGYLTESDQEEYYKHYPIHIEE
jgi:hypothetical protein